MKNRLLLGLLLSVATGACGDDTSNSATHQDAAPGDPDFVRDTALNIENISTAGSHKSHNMGQNCMTCHQEHGPGKGIFTVAGTWWNEDGSAHAGGRVELRDGDLSVLSINVDEYGNFYTTEPVALPEKSLRPVLIENDNSEAPMPFGTRSGACNICHVGRQALVVAH